MQNKLLHDDQIEKKNTMQGCIQKFRQGGGRIWGMDQRGGARWAEAQWYHVRCYTLGEGARMTYSPRPPP